MKSDAVTLIMQRLDALGKISEEAERLTRTFGSPAMQQANGLVAGWMREAGMTVRLDAIGNVIGYYPGERAAAKRLLLGSHLDTVRDAGKYDGPLGVAVGIACVDQLHKAKRRLPFAIEVIGFCDEEGVRFQSTYLGSRGIAGILTKADLQRKDANGISVKDAIKAFGGDASTLANARFSRKELLGYLEVHIEQGPVLERQNLPVGVVNAIAGQSRVRIRFTGCAGHAGTTPMAQRSDALVAAARFILEVERIANASSELVATVGQIEVVPGASNVIPGAATLSLDVRHRLEHKRRQACQQMAGVAKKIAANSGSRLEWTVIQETEAVACDKKFSNLLSQAVKSRINHVTILPSGAGHDAAVMAGMTPAAMLFVRCKEGVSHHPDESVRTGDVRVACDVVKHFLELLAHESR